MNGNEKEHRVYQVFEQISDGYDAANDRISLGMQKQWKETLIRCIAKDLPKNAALLDVCCGTGDIAIAAKKARRDLKVCGLDFSPSMLEAAKKKSMGMKDVVWLEGDAMQLPFEDSFFHAAAISFGLRNTPDFEAVLREMKRVICPGGFLYILDSFVPEKEWVLPFYKLYFRGVMPLIGGGTSRRKEYQWLWQSTESFLRESELAKLLKEIGMRHIGRKEFLYGASVLFRAEKPMI